MECHTKYMKDIYKILNIETVETVSQDKNNFTLVEIYIKMNELVDNIFVTMCLLKFSSKICVIFLTTYN